MNRVVHFEIHAKDLDKLQKFYQDVFGWDIKSAGPEYGGYRMVMTGKDAPGAQWPGINGGLTPRTGTVPDGSETVNAFVCTIAVDDIDAYIAKTEKAGGAVSIEKANVPNVGWLVYMKDPENNIFGMLQPSMSAAM